MIICQCLEGATFLSRDSCSGFLLGNLKASVDLGTNICSMYGICTYMWPKCMVNYSSPIWESFSNIRAQWAFFEKALSFLDVLKIHHIFLQFSLCRVVYTLVDKSNKPAIYLKPKKPLGWMCLDEPLFIHFFPSFFFKTRWKCQKKSPGPGDSK